MTTGTWDLDWLSDYNPDKEVMEHDLNKTNPLIV